ncbi:MAG TPA: hypothetical protein VKA19_11690 [Alphaproteobacteria bacterium]|nr:hypothetical protein [Alphaproteobacteria bacterium]
MAISITIEGDHASDVLAELFRLGEALAGPTTVAAPAAPTSDREPVTTATERSAGGTTPGTAPDDKPTAYRGKNAEDIAQRIIGDLMSDGSFSTTEDADDYQRLPKKLQSKVDDAAKSRNLPAAETTPDDALTDLLNETASTELVLHDVDGDTLAALATTEAWVAAFTDHLDTLDDEDAVKALFGANAAVAKSLGKEYLTALDKAGKARIAAVTAPSVAEEQSSDKPEKSKDEWLNEIRERVFKLNEQKDRAAVEAVLTEFMPDEHKAAPKLVHIDEARYPQLVETLDKAIAA